jgi:hypothetical protein
MNKTPGQFAYDRYRTKMEAAGHLMPPWEERAEAYREVWISTLEGIMEHLKPQFAAMDALHRAAVEFCNDWKKGDFALPRLAALDAEVLIDRCEQYREVVG